MKTCIAFLLLIWTIWQPSNAAAERVLDGGPFGEVTIYSPAATPTSLALFVSGDGGWNQGVVGMARALTDSNTLVVGIDIRKYFHSLESASASCVSPAVDLERLSHTVQRELRLPDYLAPILVGYSSGATLVYAALAQAPAGTFAGALSLGFCPDLQMPAKPCRGSGLAFTRGHRGELVFEPNAKLAQHWVALQGEKDQVCNANATIAFVSRIPSARVIKLPLVGHGFSVERHWLPQFRAAYTEITRRATQTTVPAAASRDIRDLPLSEVPAATAGDTLALLITGDGGWAGLDQGVSAELARAGMPVVGLSSLKYFWQSRTPNHAAQDVTAVLRHYLAKWHRSRIVLIGYSFGADVLPFIVNRLPQDVRARLVSVNLLGLSANATFQISVAELLHSSPETLVPTAPEIMRMRSVPVLCVYGEGEKESLCPSLAAKNVHKVRIGSGHHFSGNYRALAEAIVHFAAHGEKGVSRHS